MNSNLTMQDVEHIQALVDRIDERATDYVKTPSSDTVRALAIAIATTKEFLNGYAAALRRFEKKEAA